MFKSAVLLASVASGAQLGTLADIDHKVDEKEQQLAQSFVSAFALHPPEIIKEPNGKFLGATYLTANSTGGAFTDGYYMNTTRIEGKDMLTGQQAQEFLYMWKNGCTYTKWVPSNQFVYSGLDYNENTMTLERFGFIGMDKECYFGSIGMLWKFPLLSEMIMPEPMATGNTEGPKVIPLK